MRAVCRVILGLAFLLAMTIIITPDTKIVAADSDPHEVTVTVLRYYDDKPALWGEDVYIYWWYNSASDK